MREKNSLDDYELFYLEIPSAEADPLSEISDDIEDAHGETECRGLQADEVHKIATDSLENARQEREASQNEPPYNLFSTDSDHSHQDN